ncbi:MAG: N-acetyltransferase [Bacteroidales bacterium]|nr:MAG: N-acetyltransferase [Bacteroidales bacterium]
MEVSFDNVKNSDFEAIRDIYNYYVLNTTVTFHIKPVDIDELKHQIYIDHPKYKSIVIRSDDVICGFAYVTQYKNREAYKNTAEIGIYLRPEYAGKGIGKGAVTFLEDKVRGCGIKVLLAIISGDNSGSINFFESLNYEKCAHFKRVGEKFGKRLDVVAYQKELV